MLHRVSTPIGPHTPDACLFASNALVGAPAAHGEGCQCVFTRVAAPPRPPALSMSDALAVIWAPDRYPLEDVAEAALVVLENRFARSEDAHQASYLITTFRRATVPGGMYSAR